MSWLENASRRKKWLVGVSGGADSIALLHLLLENGFRKLVVCHLDHRLRGAASTGDAKFVEKLAAKLGVGFEGGRADVKVLAKSRKESIETAARASRHEFFRTCAGKHRCDRVVLAHHADDQAETILWNLLRGSHGLRGMGEVQSVNGLELHRPLLGWRRQELRDWLESRSLVWREDATNAEPVAVRNRLRNEVLPLLDEISGRDAVASLTRLADDWQAQKTITEFALEKADIFDPEGRIHLPSLRDLPKPLIRYGLAEYFGSQAIPLSRDSIEEALTVVDPTFPSSVVNLPGGRRFRRRAGRAFLE
jgi:tRNA(Ile)-lysidine synthase